MTKYTDYNPESIKGVVEIYSGSLYAKSPKSLSSLLDHLDSVGYRVKDTSREKLLTDERPSREVQEKNGWSLWYGTLRKDVLDMKAECDSCKKLISHKNVETHGHKCESCGDVTYAKYNPGGQIRFSIADDITGNSGDLTLLVHSYDKKNKLLNFFEEPKECKRGISPFRMASFSRSMAESYSLLPGVIKSFPETFKKGKIEGVRVISVPHNNSPFIQKHSINQSEVSGERYNFKTVKVFKGQRFREYDYLPMPESVSIYEAWHWMPLKPSPELYKKIMHAAGQVSRKDFYHQDGRPAFGQEQLGRMFKFIEHFTTGVNMKYAKKFLDTRLSGPGLINVLAKLTGCDAEIETAPNVFIAMEGIAKSCNGETLTTNERIQVEKSLKQDLKGKRVIPEIVSSLIMLKERN